MIIAVLVILGLVFGSFVNALVWRLRQQEHIGRKKTKATKSNQYSVLTGRSMCPECHHELAAMDLVPVLSWLWLRGRCRYCHKPISWQYPVVELLTAGLFLWSYLAWPLGYHGVDLFQLIVWLGFVVTFVALAVYDMRWLTLPDRIVWPLAAVAAGEVLVVAIWRQSWADVWQPVVGMVIIAGLFWGLFQVSSGKWIGGGDVKLAFALGLIAASPLRALLLLFISSLLGTLMSLPQLTHKQGWHARIPYGPYLLAAAVIVQLYGAHIISWYQNLLVV